VRIIGGSWRGRRLKPLKGRAVRPTTDRVREAWMSAMGGRMDGKHVLDLFAGSGALGLETLSRGAEQVVFVERARASLRILEANIALVEAGARSRVVATDVFRWIRHQEPTGFDVAMADPPYGTGDAARLVEAFLARPFARELWVEHPTREMLPAGPDDRTRRYGDSALTLFLART
jgi:16S rRNA (guanine966-N2)-methyltransferase